jgi:hypothetical protein
MARGAKGVLKEKKKEKKDKKEEFCPLVVAGIGKKDSLSVFKSNKLSLPSIPDIAPMSLGPSGDKPIGPRTECLGWLFRSNSKIESGLALSKDEAGELANTAYFLK